MFSSPVLLLESKCQLISTISMSGGIVGWLVIFLAAIMDSRGFEEPPPLPPVLQGHIPDFPTAPPILAPRAAFETLSH